MTWEQIYKLKIAASDQRQLFIIHKTNSHILYFRSSSPPFKSKIKKNKVY